MINNWPKTVLADDVIKIIDNAADNNLITRSAAHELCEKILKLTEQNIYKSPKWK